MKVNVGVIGAGVIGRSHLKALKGIGGANVAAVCDIVPGKAHEALAEAGLEGVPT